MPEMKAASLIAPANASDRFTEIDALRAFALLGIMLANIPDFIGFPFAEPPMKAQILGNMSMESLSLFFNFVLDGKFYTLFSLLFGLGFSLQLERLNARGAAGTAIFMRRMAVLFLFGILHMSLIWGGDILTLYALIGFSLPLFSRLSDKALLAIGLTLIFVVPFVGLAVLPQGEDGWTAPIFGMAIALWTGTGGSMEASYFDVVKNDWWRYFGSQAASNWAFYLADKLTTFRIPKVAGTMLIGMWAGRMLMRGQLIGNTKLLLGILVPCLLIAIPAGLVFAQQEPHAQTHWSSLVSTFPMGIAFGCAFLLLIGKAPALLKLLAPVGRMALTNYLGTSVLCIFTFTGAGLGLMGSVTLTGGFLLMVALFGCMIAWSNWWLSSHKQGPMEALWRRLTYPEARPTVAKAPA